MKIVTYVIIYLILILIAYSDIRLRKVYVICFPVLFAAVAFLSLSEQTFQNTSQYMGLNLLFTGIVVGGSVAITVLLRRQPADRVIGWGDFLFLFCLCPFFEPLHFMFFLIGSSAVSLVVHLICRRILAARWEATVPLAGFQSICFAILLPLNQMDILTGFFPGYE